MVPGHTLTSTVEYKINREEASLLAVQVVKLSSSLQVEREEGKLC